MGVRRPMGRCGVLLVVVLLGVSLAVPASAAAVDPTPTVRWTFDEGTGTAAADSVGDVDGVLQAGAAWQTTNVAVGAAALDARNGSMLVANAAALEPADPTVSAWIRSYGTTAPDVGDVILEKGAFGCAGPSYGLYATATGLELRWRSPANETETPVSINVQPIDAGVAGLWDGAWHLVGFTIPTVNFGPLVSIDGRIQTLSKGWSADQTTAVVYSGATNSSLRIGGPVAPGCGGGTFSGAIDDVRMWSNLDAIYGLGSLMPPVPTTVTLDPVGPLTVGTWFHATATMTGGPSGFALSFEFLDPVTLVSQGAGAGTFSQGVYSMDGFPPPVGDWILRAFFPGYPPYQPSEDTQLVTVQPAASTTTLSVVTDPVVPLVSTTLAADVASPAIFADQAPSGTVEFVESPGPGEVILGTAALSTIALGQSRATLTVPGGFGVGTHQVQARYPGSTNRSPSVGDLALAVGASPTFAGISIVGATQTHHPVHFVGSIGSPNNDYWQGATLTFRRAGGGAVACTLPMEQDNEVACTIASLPVGDASFEVVYSGNASNAGSVSLPLTITVLPDTVDATNIKTSATSIYPYSDGYRDTVSLTGTRQEPLSVAIRIYSPTGSLVRSVTLARASGAYAYAWNGRNSSGTTLAAGKYRIVQTLTDAFATTKSWTSYVTLSSKRLVTKTVYVTKAGSSVSAKGDPGNGTITVSTAGGYVTLVGRYPSGWVGVGYQFTLPSATVYKSIRFEVYSKGPRAVPPKYVGVQNFHTCPLVGGAWNEGCFERWSVLGSTGTTPIWQGASASVTTDRTSRTMRVMVSVEYSTQTVYKARIKVVYGVLV